MTFDVMLSPRSGIQVSFVYHPHTHLQSRVEDLTFDVMLSPRSGIQVSFVYHPHTHMQTYNLGWRT